MARRIDAQLPRMNNHRTVFYTVYFSIRVRSERMKHLFQTIVRGYAWRVGAILAAATVGALLKGSL